MSLRERLARPLQLLGVATVLMIADYVFTAANGEVLHLGPARAFWLAAPLALAGIALLLVNLMSGHD